MREYYDGPYGVSFPHQGPQPRLMDEYAYSGAVEQGGRRAYSGYSYRHSSHDGWRRYQNGMQRGRDGYEQRASYKQQQQWRQSSRDGGALVLVGYHGHSRGGLPFMEYKVSCKD